MKWGSWIKHSATTSLQNGGSCRVPPWEQRARKRVNNRPAQRSPASRGFVSNHVLRELDTCYPGDSRCVPSVLRANRLLLVASICCRLSCVHLAPGERLCLARAMRALLLHDEHSVEVVQLDFHHAPVLLSVGHSTGHRVYRSHRCPLCCLQHSIACQPPLRPQGPGSRDLSPLSPVRRRRGAPSQRLAPAPGPPGKSTGSRSSK